MIVLPTHTAALPDEAFRPVQVAAIDLARPLEALPLDPLPADFLPADSPPAGSPPADRRPAGRRVRVLVLRDGTPLGVAWFDTGGAGGAVLDPATLAEGIRAQLGELAIHPASNVVGIRPTAVDLPTASVVLCTAGRPAALPAAIDAILASDHPDFELLVVDNAPGDGGVAALVADRYAAEARVRLVCEPRPGLSRARNRGLLSARGEHIVFTDDDVQVTPTWLRRMTTEFAEPDVLCVTGLVEPARLDTPAQQWFEQAAGFGRGTTRTVHRLATPPAGSALFPYRVGAYGTGASMALRRDALPPGWRFDEALGAGSPTGGGEDIDLFLDVLMLGGALVYQPAALSFHTHRADTDALERQMFGYGTGLTALFTKRLLRRPAERALIARRLLAGLRHLAGGDFRGTATGEVPAAAPTTAAPVGGPGAARLRRAELRGMLAGPVRYLRGSRALHTPAVSHPAPATPGGLRVVG